VKKASRLVSASIMLFCFGALLAVIYLAELIDSGDRPVGFLESAAALLVGAWVSLALHLYRGRTAMSRVAQPWRPR
jgi:hypothetical protein